MVFPYLFHSNFEAGTVAEWTSETDTESKLNVRHYSWLAKNLGRPDAVPYLGAYAAHINLALGTADAYVQEDTAFDTALDGTIHVRFYFWASGLTMAASDRFTLFALESAAGTNEAAISLVNNAGVLQLVASETGATALGAGTRATALIQDVWHCLELTAALDDGASNDGVLTFRVDGQQVGATIGSLDQGAIVHARLGAIGIDAGTTAGHLLFDSVIADDTRVGVHSARFGEQRQAWKSGHVALGPGRLHGLVLTPANADNTVTLYDTDEADISDTSRIVLGPIQASAVYSLPIDYSEQPHYYARGLYAVLAGTNPRATVTIGEGLDLAEGQIRELGRTR